MSSRDVVKPVCELNVYCVMSCQLSKEHARFATSIRSTETACVFLSVNAVLYPSTHHVVFFCVFQGFFFTGLSCVCLHGRTNAGIWETTRSRGVFHLNFSPIIFTLSTRKSYLN